MVKRVRSQVGQLKSPFLNIKNWSTPLYKFSKKIGNFMIFSWILKILYRKLHSNSLLSNLDFKKEKEKIKKRIEIINRNKSFLWCYQKKMEIVNIFHLTFFRNFTLSILPTPITSKASILYLYEKKPFSRRYIYNNGSLISTSI